MQSRLSYNEETKELSIISTCILDDPEDYAIFCKDITTSLQLGAVYSENIPQHYVAGVLWNLSCDQFRKCMSPNLDKKVLRASLHNMVEMYMFSRFTGDTNGSNPSK